jgi:hypothetical protein
MVSQSLYVFCYNQTFGIPLLSVTPVDSKNFNIKPLPCTDDEWDRVTVAVFFSDREGLDPVPRPIQKVVSS